MNALPRIQKSVVTVCRRNLGVSAVLAQKGQATDPIQKLFLQKLKEYDQKAKSSPGKLVDSTPQIEKEFKAEMSRIAKVYGGGDNVDMTKFPDFKFADPAVDPINQQAAK